MPWYRHLLWPFAVLYGLGVWFRNRLFDLGILPSKQFDVPVICVGNLEAGGTGKSPVVLYILQLLSENGLSVAMLSRGYGRKTKGFRLVSETDLVTDVGDEPLQAKLRFPNLTVAVCEDRVKGIEQLLSLESRPDVMVMDDGFQHRWVKPSFSLLVTRGGFPFWKNHLLPVGALREAKTEKNRADALVVIGEDSVEIPFQGKSFQAKIEFSDVIQISGDEMDASELDSVVLISGIANSLRFEQLAKQKLSVLEHVKFSDHHNYTALDLQSLRKKLDSFGATAQAVVTTEKDAARLKNSSLLNELGQTPVFYLPIDISFDANDKQKFDHMILEHGKHA
ncbi:MAG: tetraacyldisaccharide 4'-kinase [Flavobacteriales bacterium]|nr:tetraacyldisaccharide 4'-kinase [Flavobacteriales bacterium]